MLLSAIQPIPWVDFTTSMRTHALPGVVMTQASQAFWQRCHELYNLYGPATLQPNPEQLRIPEILHFIWLGSPLPQEYADNIAAWRELLPTYTIKLWTEADLEAFNLANRDLFEEEINYAARSDIWRYEILYRYGGIYLDTDQRPVVAINPAEQNSLKALNHTYDFYIGIQPMDTNVFPITQNGTTTMMVHLQLGIGLIGSVPGHPLLAAAIKELRNFRHIPVIVGRTGPLFFSQVFYAHAGRYGLRDIALPPTYFYPCGYEQKSLLVNEFRSQEEWAKPESFAVHLWAGSWLKPSANVTR